MTHTPSPTITETRRRQLLVALAAALRGMTVQEYEASAAAELAAVELAPMAGDNTLAGKLLAELMAAETPPNGE